jgi:hypothetical protein
MHGLIEFTKSWLRCTKRGQECEYEYIESSGIKKRTRPAPRPTSELAKKAAKETLDLVNSLQHTYTAVESISTQASYQGLSGLFLDSVQPIGMDWEATLCQPAATISPSPFLLQTAEFPCSDSEPFVASQNLTPGQASLFNALFSLEKTASHAEHNVTSSSAPTITHAAPDVDLGHQTSQTSWLNAHHSLIFLCDPDIEDDKEDENDLEGVGEALCRVPVRLDPMVDSNSLVFVLQSCEPGSSILCTSSNYAS